MKKEVERVEGVMRGHVVGEEVGMVEMVGKVGVMEGEMVKLYG